MAGHYPRADCSEPGRERKDRLQNIDKTNVTVINDGINSLIPITPAKRKADILFTVSFHLLLSYEMSFCQSFFAGKNILKY